MQSNRIQPFLAVTDRVAPARASTPRRGCARRAVQIGALLGVLSLAACRGDEQGQARVPPAPEELYGELFVAVQAGRIFEDQKLFVDAAPRAHP
jgi:alpha,alpha-trehalase